MTDLNPTGLRRRSKVPFALTLTFILVVGSVGGWGIAKYIISYDHTADSVKVELPKQNSVTQNTKEPEQVAPPADVARQKTAAIPVNSYARGNGTALENWNLGQQNSGFLDSVSRNGLTVSVTDTITLSVSDRLEFSGWAGETVVGIRFPFVLASACGRVFAQTEVSGTRSDVATAVHPNLSRSGWRMTVAGASIPVCDRLAIRFWGVMPGNTGLLLPISGEVNVGLSNQSATVAGQFLFTKTPVAPQSLSPLPAKSFLVSAPVLNMRSCAATSCRIVGKIQKGRWKGVLVDEVGEWLLVAMSDRAGWIAKNYLQLPESN